MTTLRTVRNHLISASVRLLYKLPHVYVENQTISTPYKYFDTRKSRLNPTVCWRLSVHPQSDAARHEYSLPLLNGVWRHLEKQRARQS
ncbi:hypothetical protein LSAT2_031946 [Lamellibrachia satsuma]|nr:hypothetical protein LSAT2_031946 [Lamellibrachia satsuma]